MKTNELPRHHFRFTIRHLGGLILICVIGILALVATSKADADESMLAGGDKAIVSQLRNAGLYISDQFT